MTAELWERMKADGVTHAQLQAFVGEKKGWEPDNMPVVCYNAEFCSWLLSIWPEVLAGVRETAAEG